MVSVQQDINKEVSQKDKAQESGNNDKKIKYVQKPLFDIAPYEDSAAIKNLLGEIIERN